MSNIGYKKILYGTLLFAITLVGGIPGLISINDWIHRLGVSIQYDADYSALVTIRSSDPTLNNKIALMLYHVAVVGNGNQKLFIKNVITSLRCDKRWYDGEYFLPTHYQVENNDVVRIVAPGPNKNLQLLLEHWVELRKYQNSGLEYGQPLSFSYAAVFPTLPENFRSCDMLNIQIVDSENNKYTLSTPTIELFKLINSNPGIYLDNSGTTTLNEVTK